MEDDGLNMRNWVYYEPSRHLNLQLMSTIAERDTKPFLPGRDLTGTVVGANAAYHPRDGPYHPRDCVVSQAPVHMDYMRDSWVSHRERFLSMLPGNSFGLIPEPPNATHMHMLQQQPDISKDERTVKLEDSNAQKEDSSLKRRHAVGVPKTPKMKKAKKAPSTKENGNAPLRKVKPVKKNMDVVINGLDMGISDIPVPVCSCTGAPQQCYRWGCGGWQSACCTTSISLHPLPMSTKRRGARIAGRKMSQGAFKKVLEKLAAEGYNFANPIDLRTHWAKHGTNKFVTIK